MNFSRVISGVGGSRVCSRRGGFYWGGGTLQKEEGWCAENFCLARTPLPFGVAHHSLKDSQTHLEVCPEVIPNPVKLTTKIRHAKVYQMGTQLPAPERSLKCVDSSLWPPYEALSPSYPVCVHHVMILQSPAVACRDSPQGTACPD